MRFFNTEGPVRPGDHYAIHPLDRMDVDELLTLIRTTRYFVLHAPRQTGKTSALIAPRTGAVAPPTPLAHAVSFVHGILRIVCCIGASPRKPVKMARHSAALRRSAKPAGLVPVGHRAKLADVAPGRTRNPITSG